VKAATVKAIGEKESDVAHLAPRPTQAQLITLKRPPSPLQEHEHARATGGAVGHAIE
jgi:hypothetical protein